MRKTPLGKTGEDVSAFCLGTMHFGTVIDPETSDKILDYYAEIDGTFLDTANNYATWLKGGAGGESDAEFKNGLLKLVLPKTPKAQPKTIDVKAN